MNENHQNNILAMVASGFLERFSHYKSDNGVLDEDFFLYDLYGSVLLLFYDIRYEDNWDKNDKYVIMYFLFWNNKKKYF